MPLLYRLMSDYEVNLVNDNMQEFYVRFYGPAESMFLSKECLRFLILRSGSTICGRCLAHSRRVT
jgi:hypothetical protein